MHFVIYIIIISSSRLVCYRKLPVATRQPSPLTIRSPRNCGGHFGVFVSSYVNHHHHHISLLMVDKRSHTIQ